MARPIKNNADYFPHDAHMRNDPRVLALRRKHGLSGYAVYVMTIESMSNASNFRLDVSLTGREIMAGDFGIDETTLDSILKYCVQIDLFQLGNDVLTCNSLNKRFESLINRRVSPAETTQKLAETTQEPYSKVKESKVKQSKGEERKVEQTTYGPTHSHFVIVKSKYLHEQTVRINGKAGLIQYMEANQTILNLPEYGDKFMRNNNGKVFNELSHIQNAYSLFTQKQ